MPKSQEFKDELGIRMSPRIFRKGYLFKEIGEDSNGNISSYHDEKTFMKGSYDRNVFGIFSNLHFSEWDHTYGITHENNTALPDDAKFFDEAWSSSTPAGSVGTPSLLLNDVTSTIRGNLLITCTSSQTLAYSKSNIIDNTSTSTGVFTLEWALKKGISESSNANNFTIQVKFGQFHIQVIHGLHSCTIKEVGTAGTVLINTTQSSISNNSNGWYSRYRLIFDMGRVTKQCVLLINDQEHASVTKTQTNGSTTDNEVMFGYLATPTSTSKTLIQYIRYHNAPIFPIEVPVMSTYPIAAFSNSTSQPAASVYTLTGSFSNTSIGTNTNFETDIPVVTFNNQTGQGTLETSNSPFSSNALGNAFEVMGGMSGASSTVGKTTFTMRDVSIITTLEWFSTGNTTLNAGVKLNGVTISGIVTSTFNKYRVVVKGTGAAGAINTWLYVNDELVATQSNTTSSASNNFQMTFASTSGQGNSSCLLLYSKLFNRPAHVTRLHNKCVVAYLNGINESTTRYFPSQVTENDLDSLLASPVLSSLQVFQKDLSWGDCGFDAVGTLEQRGRNTVFTPSAGSPFNFASITESDNQDKRDSYTKYNVIYFQIRVPFTKLTNELTFCRFHRQLDVSDYVTQWGTSTFERDFLSRKINSGDLRVTLMNPDEDYDSLRQRPDIWINAFWETWIGAVTDSGTFEYPDFIGKVENIVFDSNPSQITLEITNIVKALKEININSNFQYPPFSNIITFAGSTCNSMPVRSDPADTTNFYLDSKYDLRISNVYVNGIVQSSGFTTTRNAPCRVDFTTAPTGTVTVDVIPEFPFNSNNAGTLARNILTREAGLHLNLNIDTSSLTEFEASIDDIAIKNIALTQVKLFDFLEELAINSSSLLFISSETQDTIGFDLASKVRIESETISDRNLSPLFHSCETLTISNPIENIINTIDFEFNSESIKSNFTYVNRRLVSDYDADSPIATKKIIDVFGVKTPSKRITNNPNTFFNITTYYKFIDSVTDLQTVVDRNYSPYGFRPPVYELNNVNTNIFIYSFSDVLFLMRESTTIADDTIEITRIEKNYDNLTGSIQGFSNKFIQFGGVAASLTKMFAVDDTICDSSITHPCDITGRTINPSDPQDANGVFVAVDIATDPDASFAGT